MNAFKLKDSSVHSRHQTLGWESEASVLTGSAKIRALHILEKQCLGRGKGVSIKKAGKYIFNQVFFYSVYKVKNSVFSFPFYSVAQIWSVTLSLQNSEEKKKKSSLSIWASYEKLKTEKETVQWQYFVYQYN